ncbi:anion-transporting ATPase [Wenjunlia vitaminophila]|uniref:Anion-transporting ATPase n=1 Tax=Wenjunlia vitaminophila TaxID=76728 RepID=A0A0T6LNL1_WENVI|nr:ArsA family ATPase [Wenjunlia vitaminophila]KRV47556.1 anion-transporting ATPase [Wenjunlia vitaminophila]
MNGNLAVTPLAVDPILDDARTRIVVCCGSGGVGKTTTAAALGVRAAERGRKVVVLTIDPAKRLAQSMGLTELDNSPRRVEGVGEEAGGELHAMMLDMKRTFDEIVLTHADPERARMILENPFYQSLSAGFAGTQEYMAMEKLGQLRARDEWDLIVVDTPPSRSALDFLDAPQRMSSFLDGRFIRVLMAPAKVGGRSAMKFLNVGMSMMTGTLNKVLGAHVLRDVQTFVAAMDTMFGGFRDRAEKTYQLLQAPGTAFLVVAAPERDALREASFFVERLADERMPLAGLVLNRVHRSGAPELTAERALAAAEALQDAAEDSSSTAPTRNVVESIENQAIVGIKDRQQGKAALRTGKTSPEDEDGATLPPGSRASSELTTGPAGTRPVATPGSTDPTNSTGNTPGGTTPTDDTPTEHSAELLAAGLLRLHAERMHVIARERRTRDRFVTVHPEVPIVEVSALPGDVHDLDGLRAIGERLAGG